jgi:hypothetical protein
MDVRYAKRHFYKRAPHRYRFEKNRIRFIAKTWSYSFKPDMA